MSRLLHTRAYVCVRMPMHVIVCYCESALQHTVFRYDIGTRPSTGVTGRADNNSAFEPHVFSMSLLSF